MPEYHYIYKTTNLLNDKYYIGMHSSDRLNDGYLGSGLYLKRSIKKYGKTNFKLEILHFVNDRKELEILETSIVNDVLLSDPLCMNIKIGGSGGGIKNRVNVKDKFGNKFQVSIDDERYISGELVGNNKGYKITQIPHPQTNETKDKIRLSKLKHSKGLPTRFRITNGIDNKRIDRSQLNEWLSKGWKLGSTSKMKIINIDST